jgi:hypothetical protein
MLLPVLENNRPTGHQYSIVLIRHRTVLSRHAVMDATGLRLELADRVEVLTALSSSKRPLAAIASFRSFRLRDSVLSSTVVVDVNNDEQGALHA